MADGRRIGVLVTGGTVGSRSEPLSGREKLVKLSEAGDQLDILAGPHVKKVLEQGSIETVLRQPLNMLSENMTPAHWVAIGREIGKLIEKEQPEGILVLHGTDTMSFTSAALSFMLAGVRIPVILTGSNLPPNEPETDADTNIADAMIALQHLSPGVYLSFAGRPNAKSRVHDGVSVRKARGSGPAFISSGRVHVAEVSWGNFAWTLKNRSATDSPAQPEIPFRIAADDRVMRIDLHPGINLKALADTLICEEYRGAVMTLYPALTGPFEPESSSVPKFAETCAEHEIVLALTMNAQPVGVQNSYESKLLLEETGAVLLPVIPELALVKLMWALGWCDDYSQVREVLETEICNEFGGRK
ncbi:MAG: asparaginase [Solirubrobacterales bacterium]|nr:asparaginase [Solirubrobacterales bacterium]